MTATMEQDSLSGYQFRLSESLDKCSPVCPLCVPEVSSSHQTQHTYVQPEHEETDAQRGNSSRSVLSQK